MRIVIDLQGAQSTGSRNRGIGRYSLSLAQAIVRNAALHDIVIVLNGMFPESIDEIKVAFSNLLPATSIHVWCYEGSVSHIDKNNRTNRKIAEQLREAFIASLNPDVVLITSLFEGLGDNAVTSIGSFESRLPTATILYDLIPLIHEKPYLDNPDVNVWYREKLDYLKQSHYLLSISESSRQEALHYLDYNPSNIVNISTAAEDHFFQQEVSLDKQAYLAQQYSLTKPFVMYTGGIDHRKNIEGLIRAYAALPNDIRKQHQLAIVCSIQEADILRLKQLAKDAKLADDELVLTGYVPEDDLVSLYNLTKLFVFPSWHEGFGLPALEAMKCGKAVIGTNASSLPEVIGLDEALFASKDDTSLTAKMLQVLTDENFRVKLERHALVQAKKFSWDTTALTAIKALENWHDSATKNRVHSEISCKPKLAYISPLPPEKSGISDYSAELLPYLAVHYDIDVIVHQEVVSDEWILANCALRSVEWFKQNHHDFDRVLYHFGNSHFHQHMFELLEFIPGVVVLHDFFLSGIVAHIELTQQKPNNWVEALYHSHGYHAVKERVNSLDVADQIWQYPTNLSVLQNATGVIVHSENSIKLMSNWYVSQSRHTAVIPLLRVQNVMFSKILARKQLGIQEDEFVICSFGILGPMKLNARLLECFLLSRLSQERKSRLIFVGENHPAEYGASLVQFIKQYQLQDRVQITGWTDMTLFRSYLSAADIGVQLRTLSRGETSAAVLDCMNAGLPTIVNANGSMADLDAHAVYSLPDEFSNEELITALEKLYEDESLRTSIAKQAQNVIAEKHNPTACAEQYFQFIEQTYRAVDADVVPRLAGAIIQSSKLNNEEVIQLSQTIADNFPPEPRLKQIFVDISELVQRDAKTGIQRTVRSILSELLKDPPKGYRIEPVYAKADSVGYYYARNFVQSFLYFKTDALYDEPIDAWQGDIFVGLDLYPQVFSSHKSWLQELHNKGIAIHFVVYDILAILHPDFFMEGVKDGHATWLKNVVQFDGVLCISKSVADEVKFWLAAESIKTKPNFMVDWFHLGADTDSSIPSKGLPENSAFILNILENSHSFLMVGTIEPRKGHQQALLAFEELWKNGENINLAIVGKQGWMMDDFITKLKNHPELNKKLFWLEGISDEYLEKLYAASACLIAASEGEGFGLPLIEAAQHKKPIIARDIPVFREVAGEYAYYFENDNDSVVLEKAIVEWLEMYKNNEYPKSDEMPWLTWKQSANQLLQVLNIQRQR